MAKQVKQTRISLINLFPTIMVLMLFVFQDILQIPDHTTFKRLFAHFTICYGTQLT